MKKTLFIFAVLITVASCDDRPVTENDYKKVLIDSIQGRYSVVKQISDIPLDLNFDGVANTDLSQEFTCVDWNTEYYAKISHDGRNPETDNAWFNVTVNILYNHYESNGEVKRAGCMAYWGMLYKYDLISYSPVVLKFLFDAEAGIHDAVTGYDNLLYGIVKNLRWENGFLYITYEKKFYTPDGWQTVNCYFEFEKITI